MTRAHLFGYVLAAAVVWWLFWDEKRPPTASVELGDGIVISSDPASQGDNDYLTKNATMEPDSIVGQQ